MMDWAIGLPWPWQLLAMILFGTAFWGMVGMLFVIWDKAKQTILFKYGELRRENARLKKYINQLRRENINVR